MIYFGDGETDIPSYEDREDVWRQLHSGLPAVKGKIRTAQNCCVRNVNFICKADYSRRARFGMVTTIIDKVKMEDDFTRLQRKMRNRSL